MYKLLDLFCGAGGAAAGYADAGFNVTGIDINPQPNYPFTVIQDDALEYAKLHGHKYHIIHASPPCQAYTPLRNLYTKNPKQHPDLVAVTRHTLHETERPYIIENVPGAPLHQPIRLCGSSFNLGVRRHRLFESNMPLLALPCNHAKQGRPIGVYGNGGGWSRRIQQHAAEHNRTLSIRATRLQDCYNAMGMHWGTRREVTQAIPPAYTRFLGQQIITILDNQKDHTCL